MSVTTTQNARLNTLHHSLDLQHAQPFPAEAAEAPSPNSQPAASVEDASQNPADWETQYRRVPAYRPANPALLEGDRNTYNNAIERNFIRVMFGGVALQATASQVWRATGGKVFGDRVFRVRVGGEW